jgi:ribosomal protein S18 acetylase RimI-like enzyme
MATKEDYQIMQICAKETYPVRHPVLRTGKPIETCAFNGDDLPSTMHIGLFYKNTIVGVASFMKTNNNQFSKQLQYQLRGMAILETFQGKGLGKLVLNYGEALLKNKDTELIWCNARTAAVNFYKRRDYKITGTPFNIAEIGEHYTMYKVL